MGLISYESRAYLLVSKGIPNLLLLGIKHQGDIVEPIVWNYRITNQFGIAVLLYLAGLLIGKAMENPSQFVSPQPKKAPKLKKGELKQLLIQELEEVAGDKICASCAAEYWLQKFLSENPSYV